ncbi:hypothetical protein [Chryseobacterium sp. MFBS3-17]|uniref:hypothetical protein n=1 Tax=Chryseobacterium sp. MFBS3-17 TaxID=2886689 RepID=UPI001D0EAE22|nr:hypothetical protein [Chryseobacterium sp. MFBS3-17]MCC2591529.1 hypothetical protein [Chryseobacterium sp. MFBS3-17]
MQTRDVVVFNAIHGFTMHKEDENTIRVTYPSSTAKAEFDKVSHDFFSHFKHKVHHYRIQVQYHMDAVKLKKEIVTKRSIFEQFAKINPVLKQLDEKFKLDFN